MARDAFADMVDHIRRHPAYPAAAARYVAEYAQWREDLGVHNKVIANFARARVVERLLYLHFTAQAQHRDQGATFERLAELSGADDAGARAVRTVLRLALAAGFIVTSRHPADGRQRLYLPTDALIQRSRGFTVLAMRPLDAVFPHLKICERLATDLDFYASVLIGSARIHIEARIKRTQQPGSFAEAMRLEGATTIFCVVIDCFQSGRPLPSAAEFSRRFLISQSQARAVLKAAETARLIQTAPRGRLIDAAPLAREFSETHIRFLANSALRIFDTDVQVVA